MLEPAHRKAVTTSALVCSLLFAPKSVSAQLKLLLFAENSPWPHGISCTSMAP